MDARKGFLVRFALSERQGTEIFKRGRESGQRESKVLTKSILSPRLPHHLPPPHKKMQLSFQIPPQAGENLLIETSNMMNG
jgi:hypothetical protein